MQRKVGSVGALQRREGWAKEWFWICWKSCLGKNHTTFLLTIFFTSVRLLEHLHDSNIRATGVIRQNKLAKCSIEGPKALKKKDRGTVTSALPRMAP